MEDKVPLEIPRAFLTLPDPRDHNSRHAFMDIQLVPPDRAIAEALAEPGGPVVLSDLADGTGAGSPGDSTSMITVGFVVA